MRKRLVLGNAAAVLVVAAIAYGLAQLGLGTLVSTCVVAILLVVLTSANAISVVNEILRNLSRIEEAALRVSHGESGVRIGSIDPPYDGLAYRLDHVFESLEASADIGRAETHHGRIEA